MWLGTGDILHEQSKRWSLRAVGIDEEETSGVWEGGPPSGNMKGQIQGAVLGNPILTFL